MIREIPTVSESGPFVEPRGIGSLTTDRGCLPLCSMDIRASISGMWARVRVCQVFRNSLPEPIEATYVFPLPHRSAVRRCDMYVAGRHVEGILKERGEALRDYNQAIAGGHRAAIAEEDRSEVFSLRVGNIAAGEELRVELELVLPLDVVSGEATFRFPLVVAPRYVPGISLDGLPVGQGTAADTDQVPDASRITPPVLLQGFPNPVALSLEVELDPAGLEPSPGAWRDGLSCSLHSVVNEEGPPWRVMLGPGERLDRDFVLRFPVLGETIGSTLQVTEATEAAPGLLAITLMPGEIPAAEQARPRDVVILLDRSGSMEGWKMVAARRAAGRLVDSLRDQDRFAVLAFDTVIETAPNCVEELLPASDRNRWGVIEWLGRLEARGGTEMEPALRQAVEWLAASERSTRDAIVVLVTDGEVAGEDQLLHALQTSAAGAMPRIFSVGIDEAVNAGFLQRLARLGQGECELVESEDRLDEVMDRFHRLVGTPRLTDVALETPGLSWDPQSLVPSRLPDLFEGRPLTILARHNQREGAICLKVTGRDASGAAWSRNLESSVGDPETLKSAWGRSRVRELEDRFASGVVEDYQQAEQEIVDVSLECGVLSRFTSFIAVDHSEVVEGGGLPRQIIQPVEMPEGWEPLDRVALRVEHFEFQEDAQYRKPTDLVEPDMDRMVHGRVNYCLGESDYAYALEESDDDYCYSLSFDSVPKSRGRVWFWAAVVVVLGILVLGLAWWVLGSGPDQRRENADRADAAALPPGNDRAVRVDARVGRSVPRSSSGDWPRLTRKRPCSGPLVSVKSMLNGETRRNS